MKVTDFSLYDLGGHIDKVLKVKAHSKNYVLKIFLDRKVNRKLIMSQVNYIEYLRKSGFLSPCIIPNSDGNFISGIRDYRKRYAVLLKFISKLERVTINSSKDSRGLARWVASLHRTSIQYEKPAPWYYEPISEEKRKFVDIETR